MFPVPVQTSPALQAIQSPKAPAPWKFMYVFAGHGVYAEAPASQ